MGEWTQERHEAAIKLSELPSFESPVLVGAVLRESLAELTRLRAELEAATTSDDTSWMAKYGDDREIVRAYVDARFPDGWAHDKDVIDGFAPLVHQVRLEAVRGKATESDRECAMQCLRIAFYKHSTPDPELVKETTSAITAHVAASVAPVQKRLDEAVGLIERLLKWESHVMEKCENSDHIARVYGTKQDSWGLAKNDFYDACAFITPTTEQEGQDGN